MMNLKDVCMPEVLYESDGESWWSITDPEGIDDTTAQLGLIVILVAAASVVYWIWYVVSRHNAWGLLAARH